MQFGILGCARIVRRAIVAALRTCELGQLRAIASRRGEQAAAWAAEFDIPSHYASYEELLADRSIDAVYIPLPNELHLPWVRQAAAAGKHVLCEKPLGLDAADAQAMVDVCRQHGVLLMEAFMWRHHPRVTLARRMLAEGALGQLRLVTMDFSFPIDMSDWRLDAARGGGALYDLGCYGINAARLFAGNEPAEVLAHAHHHASGVDLTMAIQLRFAGDVLAQINCSFECPKRNRFQVVGTRAALEFPGGVLPPDDSQLILMHADGKCEPLAVAPADQYAEQIDAFCRSVVAGKLEPPAEDGLANMRVVEAARAAARR